MHRALQTKKILEFTMLTIKGNFRSLRHFHMSRIERLECTVKNYAWGKLGQQSEVAILFAAGHEHEKINESTPYAEVNFVGKKIKTTL